MDQVGYKDMKLKNENENMIRLKEEIDKLEKIQSKPSTFK